LSSHDPEPTLEQVGLPPIIPDPIPTGPPAGTSDESEVIREAAAIILPAPEALLAQMAACSGSVPEGTIAQTPQEANQAAGLSVGSSTTRPLPAIPGYEILGELGRGGMGVVYHARHIRLNRPTAIKMLIGGQFADPVAQVRFMVEAEVVALVQHPNVVQVYEFGQFEGQPFFALEYVHGVTLAEKLHTATRFTARAAAEMVAKLANAIAAAHTKGIVHRDLKPANVLLDADGEPKVTDFGLAKVGRSEMTATGAIMGTPSYMSPEQAAGRTREVGTATDVYALGVILYELLSGRTPFKGDSVMETIHQVLNREPVWPRTLQSSIPRDLETICLKCLEKEPKRRYSTAEALEADLRAYLQGRPIAVRPVGTVETAIKWARRRPTMAALLLVTLLGVAGIVWKYIDAEQQRDIAEEKSRDAELQKQLAQEKQKEAEQQRGIAEVRRIEAEQQKSIAEMRRRESEEQRETAQEVSQFMGGVFEDANPLALTGRMFGVQKRGQGALTALEVVDRAAAKLKTDLLDKPGIRAALLERIGNVYLDLGRTQDAGKLLNEAMELRRKFYGVDNAAVASSWHSLGMFHLNIGELEQAGKDFEQALAMRRKHLGNKHPQVADTLFYLGGQRAFICENAQAERLLLECLAIRRSTPDTTSRDLAVVLLILGQVYFLNNEPAKALPILREAAALMDQIHGTNDLSAIVGLFINAQLAEKLGNPKLARSLYEAADVKTSKLLGDDHPILNYSRGQFADFLHNQGDHEAAAKVLRGVVASYRKTFGPDSLLVAYKLLDLARAERGLNRLEAAETAAREAVRIHRKQKSSAMRTMSNHSECLHVLGAMLFNRGEFDEANAIYREALAARLKTGVEDDRTFGIARDLSRLILDKEKIPYGYTFMTHGKPAGNPKVDFELAQTWAQAARALTRQNPKLSPDDDLDLQYLQGQAVAMLRSAAAHGMNDLKAIQGYADFKQLQDRADFQEVLRALAPAPQK